MRELQKAAAAGDHAAALAIDVFCTAVAKTCAGFAVSLGGIEMLVFAGGIGEHSAQVRAGVCERLALLGVDLDAASNKRSEPVLSSDTAGLRCGSFPPRKKCRWLARCGRYFNVADGSALANISGSFRASAIW